MSEEGEISVRRIYQKAFKEHFRNAILCARLNSLYTQAQMAKQLAMDERSYSDLERGINACSALTFALFLIYVCDDPVAFLQGLRLAIESHAESPV